MDETVYLFQPSFFYTRETDNLSADVQYAMQGYHYQDLGESEIFHQLDAGATATVLADRLFVEFGANRTQAVLDPRQNIPRSNLPVTTNRSDVDEYFVSPYFSLPIGRALTVSGDFRNRWIEYTESDQLGSEQRDANFAIDNLRRGTGLTWALRYNWQRSQYDDQPPWEYQRVTVESGLWITNSFRAFVAGGQESAPETPFDPKLEDTFWEVGFSQRLGDRFLAEFAGGDRSFGTSWRGKLDATFRRGSTSLEYQETPTTEGRNPFRGARFGDTISLDDFLTLPGRSSQYILKRFEWRLEANLRKLSILLGVLNERRDDRTSFFGDPLDDESQSGVDLELRYRLGAKTRLRIGGSVFERDFTDGIENQELIEVLAAADYRLGGKTTLTLQYSYAEQDGERLAIPIGHVANTVAVLLKRTF